MSHGSIPGKNLPLPAPRPIRPDASVTAGIISTRFSLWQVRGSFLRLVTVYRLSLASVCHTH